MRPQEIIAKKRDGKTLSPQEVRKFVEGVCNQSWADYQISAFLMACYTKGLNTEEQTSLTQEMLNSGDVLDFSEIEAPKADKHSTGGVGDKTSLIIAPLAAACGLAVPMISGRGLGHTGGTLDKLEAISGYNVNLSLADFRRIIKKCGFSMIGQTAEIAPADKKIYALRNATATVSSIPLIVASIMSKKLAEGLDALVLDVKTGNGAFMESFDESIELAQALVQTGKSCGVKTEAIISDMSQPLGKFVGNALEIYECIKILTGAPENLMRETLDLSIELTSHLLVSAGISESLDEARIKCAEKITDGSAYEKFEENIHLQGGDIDILAKPEILIGDELLRKEIRANSAGFVREIDTKALGNAISEIGGGRTKVDDVIDFAVGFECQKKIGDEIKEGESLGVLYCRNASQTDQIYQKILTAYQISEEKFTKSDLIQKIIS